MEVQAVISDKQYFSITEAVDYVTNFAGTKNPGNLVATIHSCLQVVFDMYITHRSESYKEKLIHAQIQVR